MFLCLTDPLGRRDERTFDAQGLSLGTILGEHADNVSGCLINGRFRNDWRDFVGSQGDRVEILGKTGWVIVPYIISMIISIALSMIMRALMPQPKKPKQVRKAEAFGIAGLNNTTGAGTPKFVCYGQNRIHGHIIGSGATLSSDGRQVFGRILYFMGATGLDGYESITEVTLDETDASQFEELRIETRLGVAGQTVIPEFENTDELFNDNRELAYDRPTTTGTPIVYTTRGTNIQRATLMFSFPTGLYRVNKTGRTRGVGVTIRIETKRNVDPAYTVYSDFQLSETTVSAVFKTFEINFPSASKWDIRVTKIGDGGFSEGEPFFADAILFNVQETIFTTRTYDDSALLALINIPAKKIKSLESLRASALVKGKKVKVWDGESFTTEWTRKRCWIVRDMMTHPMVGMGAEIEDDEIDDDQWLESQDYYDELVLGHSGNEVRDLCDVVINDSQWDWEWVKGLAGEGRGRIIPSSDKWKYVLDKPGIPRLLYAEPGNIIDGSLTAEISQTDRSFNQVIAEFRDETNDYKPDIAPPITDPDIGSDPLGQESRRYDSITRESEVQRENMIILKREKLEKRRFSFASPMGAIVSEPMDIDYLSERAIGDEGAYTGFVSAGSTLNSVILPFPVTLIPAETYAVIIRHQADNTVEYRTVATTSGTWAQIIPSSAFVSAPAENDLFAVGIENLDHIPTRAQDLTFDNEGRVKQLRSEYVPAVYTADPLPPKQGRRFFRLGDQPPPLPLRDAVVREEVVVNKDGSIRSMLFFDVTPGLLIHAGQAQGGNTNFITLESTEPIIDDYYNTAVLRIIAGTAAGQEKKIIDYNGTTQQAFPETNFSPAPDATSRYEIEWTRFGDFGGFKVEITDDPVIEFTTLVKAYDTHWEMDGRGAGPGAEYFRFTPFSINGVENTNGRWVKQIVLQGDLSAPAPPVSIALTAYLKSVSANVTFNVPMAEDFSSVELEFWRTAVDTGVLIQTARYGATPDTGGSGVLTINAGITFYNEAYGAVIYARGRSVDTSNNKSGDVISNGVTLALPSEFGPDTEAPAIPTGLTLTTGMQPDPKTGQPVVYLEASWNPNTEQDISSYELQYRQQGTLGITVRIVSHPQVSNREIGVVGNVTYEAKIQAIDTSLNKSGFSSWVTRTTLGDVTPPAPPTNLYTMDGYQQILIRFDPPTDIDFDCVEVFRSLTNDLATAYPIGDSASKSISYTDIGLGNDITVYYWLRSRDFSRNVSAFVPAPNAGLAGHTWLIGPNDVVAEHLITKSAQIDDALITNAHITNLSADKLEAGTLQAFYSIGVGGGLYLDGTNRLLIVQDLQPRSRIFLGRLGPNDTDYGMTIYGADGSIWFSISEGLNMAGIAPSAAGQVARFVSDGSWVIPSPFGLWIAASVALWTYGGPVLINARMVINVSTPGEKVQFEIWRGPPDLGILLDSIQLGDGPCVSTCVDQPAGGQVYGWYFCIRDLQTSGLEVSAIKMSALGIPLKV